jgi:hypothetical protein
MRTVRIDLAAVPLYHGGVRGLRPGSLILPPSRTGAASTADYGNGACRRDRVYATIDLDAARFYAAMYVGAKPGGRIVKGLGSVYEVLPLDGALEHDEDCNTPGYSFAFAAGRIVRVVERNVRFPEGVTPENVADLLLAAGGMDPGALADLGKRTSAAGR